MRQLHSYWRMDYVESPKYPEGNPFVVLPQNGDDRESHILRRGPFVYLMLNRFPYNAGHLLAVPYREVHDLPSLNAGERMEMMETLVFAQNLLTRAFRPDGFNIGFNIGVDAGAGIARHLHGHIVPRWRGDTNFMPVMGDTRVLPESLDAVWARLKDLCEGES